MEEHKVADPLAASGHASGDGPEAYAAAGQGPDVGGGQTWEEQTAESGGEGAPAGVAGQTEGHSEGGAKTSVDKPEGEVKDGDEPVDAETDSYQQQRFREARAGRKLPPRRMSADSARAHRHSLEERARADAPYSESLCELKG